MIVVALAEPEAKPEAKAEPAADPQYHNKYERKYPQPQSHYSKPSSYKPDYPSYKPAYPESSYPKPGYPSYGSYKPSYDAPYKKDNYYCDPRAPPKCVQYNTSATFCLSDYEYPEQEIQVISLIFLHSLIFKMIKLRYSILERHRIRSFGVEKVRRSS